MTDGGMANAAVIDNYDVPAITPRILWYIGLTLYEDARRQWPEAYEARAVSYIYKYENAYSLNCTRVPHLWDAHHGVLKCHDWC